jgi:hypothetical protein
VYDSKGMKNKVKQVNFLLCTWVRLGPGPDSLWLLNTEQPIHIRLRVRRRIRAY